MELKGIHTRAYNRFNLDEFEGTITKFSNTERLRNEINYYRSLPESLKIWFPRLLAFDGSEEQDAWLTLEYYNYSNLGELMVNPTPAPIDVWSRILVKLRTILAEWWNFKPQSPNWITDATEFAAASRMYIDKTWNEYTKLVESLPRWKVLTQPEVVIINGVKFDNFHIIWPHVLDYILREIVPSTEMCFIHGDFCFSNILYSVDERLINFKFVDPRGSFGEKGIWGDPRYDVAKLMHSADGGYEFLNKDQFKLTNKKYRANQEAEYEYSFIGADNMDISAEFDRVFFEEDHRFDRKQILTIQGLIYIGMAARHYENPERQITQYLIGVERLNEAMSL